MEMSLKFYMKFLALGRSSNNTCQVIKFVDDIILITELNKEIKI